MRKENIKVKDCRGCAGGLISAARLWTEQPKPYLRLPVELRRAIKYQSYRQTQPQSSVADLDYEG